MELDEFTQGYIECALWAECDNSREDCGGPLEDSYGVEDISPESLAAIIETCRDFQQANADLLKQYVEEVRPLDFAGHDFWLTRNGHGAGFWDRGAGELGTKLTEAAKAYGGCDIVVGDDGKLYFS